MQSRQRLIQDWAHLLVASMCLAACPAIAQEGLSDIAVSQQIVESRIAEVQAATDLDEAIRSRLIEDYRKTLGFIETTRAYNEKANAFGQARDSAPRETEAIREKLGRAAAAPVEVELSAGATSVEIESRLQTERANQAAVAATLNSLEQQLAAESRRSRVVRERLLEASKLVDKLAIDLQSSIAPDQSPLVREAQRWVLVAQTTAINAEIRMLDQELLSQPGRLSLMQAQRDSSTQTLTRMDKRVQLLEEMLNSQRRRETEQVIADFDTAVDGQVANYPLIRNLSRQNDELGRYLQTLTEDLEQAEAATGQAAVKVKEVQQNYQNAQQRLQIAGLTQSLGAVLQQQRGKLPNLRNYRERSRKREQLIAQTGLQNIQMDAEWRDFQDVQKYVDDRLAEFPEAERAKLMDPLLALATGHRILLKNVIALSNDYMRALGELDFQENQLQATASEFNDFLVQRLLWVRNLQTFGFMALSAIPGEIVDFIDMQPWRDAFGALFFRLTESPLLWLVSLACGWLAWKKAALRKALRATAVSVGRPSKDSFASTLRALGITVMLALTWPLLSVVAGWELTQSIDASDGAKAIGIALMRLARFLFFLSVFRAICISGGLAEAHFKWPSSATRALRVQLDQLLVTFLLPAFVLVTAVEINPEGFVGELVRIMFVLASVGLLAFAIRALRPNSGILDMLRYSQDHPVHLAWLWFVLGTAIPAAFAIAALAGYMYSAMTLMSLLISSLWLLLGLVIAHQLASRWLLVVSGRLHLKVALERRDAARAAREKAAQAPSGGEDVPLPVEDEEIDVASIDADTHKLLSLALAVFAVIGISAIWSSVLPAFTILRDVTLWEYLDGPTGQQQLVPVTLADFLLTLVYIFVSIVAARTVPSLVEAVLRQRDTIQPGTRVAFITLARYGIVLLGISLVASAIGFNWGKLQWLVAALGVGIGFGLQEIIANFISGIIILVERPIRVGDLVTVGDTSGTVTRLQIRATTVTNFDRQELLVPNKEFITGRVLNWSLSDDVIRLVVQVGVAYGTDMPKAIALVNEAVQEHESVLNDPQPLITFDSFGDNSLNIVVRCFIGSLRRRREVASDLNLAINQKFNDAGIVIAFPQRDVHLDTSSPLDIRIQHASDGDEPAAK